MEKKTKKIIVVVAVVAVIAVVAGAAVWYNSPTQKVQRLLDLGQQYLLAEDYEQAVETYKGVLSIDPRNEEAVEGALSAYSGWGNVLVSDEKYSEAVAVYEEARELLPENTELVSAEADVYISWAQGYVDEGNYDKALEIINEGYEKTNDKRLLDVRSDIERKQQIAEYEGKLHDFAVQLAEYCNDGNYKEASRLLATLDSTMFEKVGGDNYISHDTGYKDIGIYDAGQWLYYGDYSGDSREGYGIWISDYLGGYIYCEGDWERDFPNGHQIEHFDIENPTTEYSTQIEGDCKDGLWNGNVTDILNDNSILSSSYDNGKVNVIERDEWDSSLYVIGRCISGSHTGASIVTSEERLNDIYGIVGIVE